jgi:glycosyltransferase involved in cell wall biosynthesis
VLALADRVTTASGAMLDLLESLGRSATLVPLGVDLDRWPPCSPGRREVTDERRVLAVGSINRVKGFDTLVRAVAHLTERGVALAVDVVGEDTLAGEVQDLATHLGVDSSISFHGFMRHADLRTLMDRASVLVVSSRHEAGPVAALEAVVAGVPVVGTDVGHLRDWRRFGLQPVRPGDWQGLAQAIEKVITDRDDAIRVAERIHIWAAIHDADWTATEFERLYRAV